MSIIYVIVTATTALALAYGAWQNFARHPIPVAAARRVRTPDRLHDVIGTIFVVAAVGVLLGLVYRPAGIAATGGLVLFFLLAVLVICACGTSTSVRRRWRSRSPLPYSW